MTKPSDAFQTSYIRVRNGRASNMVPGRPMTDRARAWLLIELGQKADEFAARSMVDGPDRERDQEIAEAYQWVVDSLTR